MRTANRYLSPLLLQSIGIVGVAVSLGFWMLTGRQSALFVGTFSGMALYGGWRQTVGGLVELTARSKEGDVK